jgi:hypothetical protein
MTSVFFDMRDFIQPERHMVVINELGRPQQLRAQWRLAEQRRE